MNYDLRIELTALKGRVEALEEELRDHCTDLRKIGRQLEAIIYDADYQAEATVDVAAEAALRG